MKINARPSWIQDLDSNALNSLSINDSRNTDGSSEVIMHPAFESIDDDKIFESLEDILSRVTLTDALRKIEDSNRDKFGPRSIAKNWESRKESLYNYFSHEDHDPGGFDVGTGTLRALSLKAASSELIKSSSAGLPYLVKKGSILTDAVNNYERQRGEFPCMLYTRTQENSKTRNVWGYPISDTLQEQMIFRPYLTYEKKLPHRAALLGPDEVDLAITRMFAKKTRQDIVVSLDFSSFDATVKPSLSYLAFSHIASQFQQAYAEEIYRVYRRFVTIPIWTPDGEVVGPHGVPSGSSFTNTVDSIAQYIASGLEFDCQIQGDDGIYVLNQRNYDSLLDRMKSNDFIVNEEKSDVFEEEEGVYLQRYYNTAYRNRYTGAGLGGVYSIFRALARIKYLERWTNMGAMRISGADFFAIRTITILENCKHHPAFPELVRYVASLDRQGLAYSEQGLLAYSKSMNSKAAAGVFNQYGLQKGINRFETVKLLKAF